VRCPGTKTKCPHTQCPATSCCGGVSVCVLCGSPVWPSPPVAVGPLWGPPLCVGPLCGSPVRVPCVGPLCGSPLCGSPVWVPCVGPSSRCVPCGIYSRDVSRSFTRSRSSASWQVMMPPITPRLEPSRLARPPAMLSRTDQGNSSWNQPVGTRDLVTHEDGTHGTTDGFGL